MIGEKITALIPVIAHGFEFDDLENFTPFSGTPLYKECISPVADRQQNYRKNKNRTQQDKRYKCSYKIKYGFNYFFVQNGK